MKIEDFCNQKLALNKTQNGFRYLKETVSKADHSFSIGNQKVVNFCSNDYLGLSSHPEVIEKTHSYVQKYGCSSKASPLVCGHNEAHRALEQKLSAWKGKETAILFSSGYAANVGVLSSLMQKGDLILGDKKNHASLIDGCQLSSADFRTYLHNDINSLEKLLKKKRNDYQNTLIVTDAVFSMDGDLADLESICQLAEKYDCWVMVDEAHATGVIGERGAGLVKKLNLENKVDLVMGTLSKALASQGGYIACNSIIKSYLVNYCRSYIYSTSLSPASCGSAIAAIDLIKNDLSFIDNLRNNCHLFSLESGLKSQSSIFPYIIGDAELTLEAEKEFLSKGFFVQSIRPPTVAPGTSRLRITIRANHSKSDIESLASLIKSRH